MKKKLTLTIEESVKEKAKQYASQQGTSVSEMVEQYLNSVTRDEGEFIPEPGSVTESLMGSVELPPEYKGMSYKEIKRKELLKKYGQ